MHVLEHLQKRTSGYDPRHPPTEKHAIFPITKQV